MGIADFLTDKDNEIEADDRYDELGNGVYTLIPIKHIWKQRNGFGTFIGVCQVESSRATHEGLNGYPVSEPGALRAVKINGFGNDESNRRAMSQLKKYLSRVLGRDVREKRDWKGDAAKLVEHAENPTMVAQLSGVRLNLEAKVCPPKNPKGQDWRFITYL